MIPNNSLFTSDTGPLSGYRVEFLYGRYDKAYDDEGNSLKAHTCASEMGQIQAVLGGLLAVIYASTYCCIVYSSGKDGLLTDVTSVTRLRAVESNFSPVTSKVKPLRTFDTSSEPVTASIPQ